MARNCNAGLENYFGLVPVEKHKVRHFLARQETFDTDQCYLELQHERNWQTEDKFGTSSFGFDSCGEMGFFCYVQALIIQNGQQ